MIINSQNCNWNLSTCALGKATDIAYVSGLDAAV